MEEHFCRVFVGLVLKERMVLFNAGLHQAAVWMLFTDMYKSKHKLDESFELTRLVSSSLVAPPRVSTFSPSRQRLPMSECRSDARLAYIRLSDLTKTRPLFIKFYNLKFFKYICSFFN